MTEAKINWPAPPSDWFLGTGEIHVWATSLEPTGERLAAYASMLSPDETVRASRFHFERARNRFFSSSESECLKGLRDIQKSRAFFNLWTRKEAWLKATGDGISDSLNQVEVSFLAGEPARLIRLFGKTEAVQNWTLHELVPAP